jgi:hypothetical protein
MTRGYGRRNGPVLRGRNPVRAWRPARGEAAFPVVLGVVTLLFPGSGTEASVGQGWPATAAPVVHAISEPAPDTVVLLLQRAALPPDSLHARARNALEDGAPAGRGKAREYFLTAVQLAPEEARGYVGVSDTYFRGLPLTELPPEWTASAVAFAVKAVTREPESAEAHFGLAIAAFQISGRRTLVDPRRRC